ncbi:MAG: xanthine dehydrogenase family protein molybdopterin-binding subunit [Acidobacteriota bacterium]
MNPLNSVGHRTPRIDALLRVTGHANYTGDLHLPGMLYGRVLRSPHPHANVRKIDVSKALKLAGVKAILTPENCDVTWSGGDQLGQRKLFNNPVRYFGDSVAAVAAVDRHVAEEALLLIEVDYDVLPFVLDVDKALAEGAPEVHAGGNLSPNNQRRKEPQTYKRGDVAQGLAAADHVLEGSFETAHHNNAQLEMRVALAEWEGKKLTVYASTQGIANCQRDIAKDLKLQEADVRVVCQYMGGGFGNKNQAHDFDLMAAMLAKEAGAPVKLEFTRKEDFVSVHGRWSSKQSYKVGVKNDGTLTAIQLIAKTGMGAYRKSSGDLSGTEIYQVPHLETSVTPVYTNTAVSANYRAPAYPQGVFGVESMMDDAAYRVKMDPLEFRLKNMTRKFRDQTPYTSFGLEDCLRKGAEAFGWKQRWKPVAGSGAGAVKRGAGMGMGMFGSALGRSSAVARVDSQGQFYIHVGVTDCGTAAKTTMGLIAAEEFGVPLSKVTVRWGDTDSCPFSVGESGSRTTVQTGNAVVAAVKDLKQQIADKGLPKAGEFLTAMATPTPQPIQGSRQSFVAHFAEVEVNIETGRAIVTKFTAAHDSGRIVNPLTAESQVQGGSIQGIGMALHEELRYDQRSGRPINAGYYGARIMTHMDAPSVDVLWIETDDPYGPFGAKTLGEPTIIPTVAAVANAIYNAIGVRMTSLPMTREKILDALNKSKAGGAA